MNVKPVETMPVPGYPDKYAEESRQALSAARPRRWVAAPLAVGVLSATVAIGMGGCGHTLGLPVRTPIESQPGDSTAIGELAALRGTPIPLFEFGAGTGSIGCVSIAAPVFLSEEEAFAILSIAFAEAGLALYPENRAQSAILPVTDLSSGRNPNDSNDNTTQGDLTPDGSLGGLPVEFVSVADVEAWEGDTGIHSTVVSFPVKQTAKTLAENNPGLVVFYDPASYVCRQETLRERYNTEMAGENSWFKTKEEARAASEQQLRQQVQAFLLWLQEEGTR